MVGPCGSLAHRPSRLEAGLIEGTLHSLRITQIMNSYRSAQPLRGVGGALHSDSCQTLLCPESSLCTTRG